MPMRNHREVGDVQNGGINFALSGFAESCFGCLLEFSDRAVQLRKRLQSRYSRGVPRQGALQFASTCIGPENWMLFVCSLRSGQHGATLIIPISPT